jgi:putative membrane protein
MMYHDGWWFLGMHGLWWLFWIFLIVLFFSLIEPTSRGEARRRRTTPLEILQKRYAAGDISTEEYEERKARLVADAPPTNDDAHVH